MLQRVHALPEISAIHRHDDAPPPVEIPPGHIGPVVLPGSVTVTCGRSAFARPKGLTTLGATLRSPASPMSWP